MSIMVMSWEGGCDALAPSAEEARDGERNWDILFLACVLFCIFGALSLATNLLLHLLKEHVERDE